MHRIDVSVGGGPVRTISVVIDDGRDSDHTLIDLDGGSCWSSEITRNRSRRVDVRNGTVRMDTRWLGSFAGQVQTFERVTFDGYGFDGADRPVAPSAVAYFRDCSAMGMLNGFTGAAMAVGCRVRGLAADAYSNNYCTVCCTADDIGGQGDGRHADLIQIHGRDGERRDNILYHSVVGRGVKGQTLMVDSVTVGSAAFVNIASDSDTVAGKGGRRSHILSRFDHLLIDGLSMPKSVLAFRMAEGEQGRVCVRNSVLMGVGAGDTRDDQDGECRREWIDPSTVILNHYREAA